MSRPQLMQGNEACVEGALRAGLRFFAGYPITPSTEIAELLSERLPRVGGKFIQMEDEIASMAAVIGASLAGLRAMTATSGPGFSLKQENLGYAAITETPCVVVDVQRVGPSTGMPTSPAQGDVMQARWGTHGDHPIVVLSPSSVLETYTLTMRAFAIAEKLRTPVILLSDEVVGHMREGVELPPPTASPQVGDPRPVFGQGKRALVTGLYHDPTGFWTESPQVAASLLRRLQAKVDEHREEITFVDRWYLEDAEVAVVAYGCVARSALRAVRLAREKGVKAGLLRPATIWPFPRPEVAALAGRVRALVVPEMNLGQLVGEVERAACGRCQVVPYNRVDSELIAPEEVLSVLEGI
ncbi:MAG TPA: 2-oxoacid:acceptor oxidoreductase subunit alpha [Firmicutes bacterium]|nr:2-oxoacid:acceptor oxidoreductase subunit alpha [Bacillota bacterium]